jgi:hypothetical protein
MFDTKLWIERSGNRRSILVVRPHLQMHINHKHAQTDEKPRQDPDHQQSKAKTSNLLLLESQSPKASRLCTLFSGASPRSSACRDRPSDRYSCIVVVPSHRQPSSHGATMPASRMRPSAQRERHDVRLLWGAGRACVGSRKGTSFCPFLQRRRERG